MNHANEYDSQKRKLRDTNRYTHAVVHLYYRRVISVLHFKQHPGAAGQRALTGEKRLLCDPSVISLGQFLFLHQPPGWLVPSSASRAQEGPANDTTRGPQRKAGACVLFMVCRLGARSCLQLSSGSCRCRANPHAT